MGLIFVAAVSPPPAEPTLDREDTAATVLRSAAQTGGAGEGLFGNLAGLKLAADLLDAIADVLKPAFDLFGPRLNALAGFLAGFLQCIHRGLRALL